MSEPICFAANPLDRVAVERRDPAWVARALDAPESRFLGLWKLDVLVKEDSDQLAWARGGLRRMMDPDVGAVLLGCRDGVAHFAVDLSAVEDPLPTLGLAGAARFEDLRAAASRLDPVEAGIAAQARSLVEWHASHRHCSGCGARTRVAGGGAHRECETCGTEHFPRVNPVAILVVSHGDRCLLGRQKGWPQGMYSALAGFVEPGETVEDAARREVFEEAGVRVGAVRYHSSQPWPFPSSLMIGLLAEAETDAIEIDRHELEDAAWFERATILEAFAHGQTGSGLWLPPPLALAHHLLRAWAEGDG
jgi:NAD+ diphosphatase